MVGLPLNYCIDSTEVTQGQYQAWLDTNPSLLNQISVCSWNTSFTSAWWPLSPSDLDLPVVHVDWCDAYAYCAGVGKRLCGKIGGGSNGYDDYANVSLDQWYDACTSNGTYAAGYPYGNTYQPSYCNGYDYWGDNLAGATTLAVGSLSMCQSSVAGYAGVYDLSGNVWEWEDTCNGASGQSDLCRLRGGALNFGSDGLECAFDGISPVSRTEANEVIGFRCCSP